MRLRPRPIFGIVLLLVMAVFVYLNCLAPSERDLLHFVQGVVPRLAHRYPFLTSRVALSYPSERTRLDVVEWLRDSDDIAAVTVLFKGLDDDNQRVRLRTIRSLGRLEDPRAVKPLMTVLRKDPEHCEAAARALAKIGVPAIDSLSALVDYPDPLVRLHAVQALGRIHGDGVNGALFLALKDEIPLIRAVAAAPLGLSGFAEVADTLMRLNETAWGVTEPAIYALDSLAVPALIRAVQGKKWEVRESAIGFLGGIGDSRAIEPLLERLADRYMFTRIPAARALGRIGDPLACPALLEAYLHESSRASGAIGEALLSIWGEVRVGDILPHLESRNILVRKRAAEMLSLSTDPAAMQALAPLLRDSLCAIRVIAVGAQESIGRPSISALMNALGDSCFEVRTSAAHALSHLQARQSLPLLTKLARKDVEQVRIGAIDALGKLGGRNAESCLVGLLHDQNEKVILQVLNALIKLNASLRPSSLIHLTEGKDTHIHAKTARVLGNSSYGDALQYLEQMLQDQNSEVVKSVIKALTGSRDDHAVELLAGVYETRKNLRSEVIDALSSIGTPPATAFLVDCLGGGNGEHAMEALRSLWPSCSQALLNRQANATPLRSLRSCRIMMEFQDFRCVPRLIELMGCGKLGYMDKAIGILDTAYEHVAPQLEHATRSENVFVRLGACGILYLHDRKEFAHPIVKELQSPNHSLRSYSVRSLYMFDVSEYRDHLRPLLRDADPEVRKEALIGLCDFNDRAAVPDIARLIISDVVRRKHDDSIGPPRMLDYTRFFFATFGVDALEELSSLLRGKDAWLQRIIWDEIAQNKDPVSVPFFMALLEQRDYFLRLKAKSALAEMGEPALCELRANIQNGNAETRRTAAYVMGKIGDAGDLVAIDSLINDGNRSVRIEATRAKARIVNRTNRDSYPRRKPARLHWYSVGNPSD